MFYLQFDYCIIILDVSNDTVTTMASETNLFNKRLSIIFNIAKLIEDSDICDSLQALENRVLKTGNLNSGGKFEWIDSLLVKVC